MSAVTPITPRVRTAEEFFEEFSGQAKRDRELADAAQAAFDANQSARKDKSALKQFVFEEASKFVDHPPMRWLIPGVLPQAELAVIYGASGSGKSFLAFDMAAAITRGAKWCGRQCVKSNVAIIAAEGAHGMRERVRAYATVNGGYQNLPRVCSMAPDLMERDDPDAIAREMKSDYSVLIVDTLSRSHNGNENSGADMGRVLKYCQLLNQATSALIVLIHHAGKDEARGQRGWSGLKAAADAEIEVTRHKVTNARNWSISKMKDCNDDFGMPFKLVPLSLGRDSQGEERSSCTVSFDVKPPPPPTAQPEGDAQKIVFELMTAMGRGAKPTIARLMELGAEKIPRGDAKRDRRTLRIKEAAAALCNKRILDLCDKGDSVQWRIQQLPDGDWLDEEQI